MSKRLQQSQSISQSNKQVGVSSSKVGYVVDVILDDSHPRVKSKNDLQGKLYSDKDLSFIYSAVIRLYSDTTTPDENLVLYKPYDPTNIEIPLIGEVVEIVNSNQGGSFYRRIPAGLLNKGSAIQGRSDKISFQTEKSDGGSKDYSTTSQTGTTTEKTAGGETQKGYGKYFTHNPVNKLKLYEGDKLIQSRFGQSIRFSGYNNANNVYSPTIIIRNRQDSGTLSSLKEGDLTEENVNNDGTSIILSSGEYEIPFTATTSISPNKFSSYPNPLKGDDHLLINSGKILISSKTGPMVFISKGDYGFISDGKFAIDGGLGADLDFGGDVNITTDRSNSNFLVKTGSGRLFLNTNTSGKSPNTDKSNEPLVRGNTLKEILETMVDLINAQVYRTPSGPTAVGPENRADFNALKRRLSEMLSTLNYTE